MRHQNMTVTFRVLLPIALVLATATGADGQEVKSALTGAEKDKLLRTYGGNSESEAGVARGLAWLARKQLKDGSWEFDGRSNDKVAATGMALLPFLGAGQWPDGEAKYAKQVKTGLDWLIGKMGSGGSMGSNNMYAHAIATIALCESAGQSKDEKLRQKATQAATYIVHAQGRNGSWGYTGPAPSEGDTSIVGWQIQALTAAQRAGLKIDKLNDIFGQADKFLDSVSTDGGAKYGYRERGASQTLTPVGLLSRHAMVKMVPADREFGRGVEFLKGFPPQKGFFDMYYYFYATRITMLAGGDYWHKVWNPKMRDMLIDLQKRAGEDVVGSWDKDQGFIGSSCGRLGTTAMAILTLEVYYRDGQHIKQEDKPKADR